MFVWLVTYTNLYSDIISVTYISQYGQGVRSDSVNYAPIELKHTKKYCSSKPFYYFNNKSVLLLPPLMKQYNQHTELN